MQFIERRRLADDNLAELVSLTQTRYEDAPAAKSKKHNAPAKCLSEMPYRIPDDPVVNKGYCTCQDKILPDAGIHLCACGTAVRFKTHLGSLRH